MRVKFIGSTNKSFDVLNNLDMDIFIGVTLTMNFNENVFDQLPFDFRRGEARTSGIKQINYNEISLGCYDIIVETHNSTYTFRYGKLSTKKPFTQEEKTVLAMAAIF